MDLPIFQNARFEPAPDQADQTRISDSVLDEAEQPSMIKAPEGLHDTIPITTTQTATLSVSLSCVRTIPLMVSHSSSSAP